MNQVGAETYDAILFYSFVLLVPVATVLAVLSKLRHVLQLLHPDTEHDTGHGNAERRHHAFRMQSGYGGQGGHKGYSKRDTCAGWTRTLC